MGTLLIIAIAAFVLIGAQQRAALLAAVGNSLGALGNAAEQTGTVLANQGPDEIPYGGSAGAIPNSSGFNPDPVPGLQITYLGTGSGSASTTPGTGKTQLFTYTGGSPGPRDNRVGGSGRPGGGPIVRSL